MADPKGPPSRQTFWSGLEAPDPLVQAWWPRPFFPAKNGIFKSIKIMISHHQSIDNSLLSSHKKWLGYGQKRMPAPIYLYYNFLAGGPYRTASSGNALMHS